MRISLVAGTFSMIVGFLLTTLPGVASAQTSAPTEGAAVSDRSHDLTAEDESPIDDEEKQRAATAAVYLAAGVAFVGILLIALVLIWGVRVRRLARTRVPSQSHPDPLWYLRTRTSGPVREPSREERRDGSHE